MPFAKTCPRCGAAFIARQQKVKYCSRECAGHSGGAVRAALHLIEVARKEVARIRRQKANGQ